MPDSYRPMSKRSALRGIALKGSTNRDNSDASSCLPVRQIIGANGARSLAIHVSGMLDDKRLPLICIADYCRNMLDFKGFIGQFHRHSEIDWPIVLIDLPGHGRSKNRQNPSRYTTLNDAHDIAAIVGALGLEKAVFLGQGYGGQVIMALASQHCHLIAGAVLIDATPIINAPGLVRMRDNMLMMLSMRNQKQFLAIGHQVFGRSHPGATPAELDEIIERTFSWIKSSRAIPRFDIELLKRLEHIQSEDVFEPQWPMFNMLVHAPLLLMRTQLTDQLRRATFDQMASLRSDSVQLAIPGQGSPALLTGTDEVGTIVDFVAHVGRHARISPIVCG